MLLEAELAILRVECLTTQITFTILCLVSVRLVARRPPNKQSRASFHLLLWVSVWLLSPFVTFGGRNG